MTDFQVSEEVAFQCHVHVFWLLQFIVGWKQVSVWMLFTDSIPRKLSDLSSVLIWRLLHISISRILKQFEAALHWRLLVGVEMCSCSYNRDWMLMWLLHISSILGVCSVCLQPHSWMVLMLITLMWVANSSWIKKMVFCYWKLLRLYRNVQYVCNFDALGGDFSS